MLDKGLKVDTWPSQSLKCDIEFKVTSKVFSQKSNVCLLRLKKLCYMTGENPVS